MGRIEQAMAAIRDQESSGGRSARTTTRPTKPNPGKLWSTITLVRHPISNTATTGAGSAYRYG